MLNLKFTRCFEMNESAQIHLLDFCILVKDIDKYKW